MTAVEHFKANEPDIPFSCQRQKNKIKIEANVEFETSVQPKNTIQCIASVPLSIDPIRLKGVSPHAELMMCLLEMSVLLPSTRQQSRVSSRSCTAENKQHAREAGRHKELLLESNYSISTESPRLGGQHNQAFTSVRILSGQRRVRAPATLARLRLGGLRFLRQRHQRDQKEQSSGPRKTGGNRLPSQSVRRV